jgi:hypothetical protein
MSDTVTPCHKLCSTGADSRREALPAGTNSPPLLRIGRDARPPALLPRILRPRKGKLGALFQPPASVSCPPGERGLSSPRFNASASVAYRVMCRRPGGRAHLISVTRVIPASASRRSLSVQLASPLRNHATMLVTSSVPLHLDERMFKRTPVRPMRFCLSPCRFGQLAPPCPCFLVNLSPPNE